MLSNSRDIIHRLEAEGWVLVRIRGSHRQYRDPKTRARTTVPHPKKDLPPGTVRSIYKAAGWTKN